jgi:Zn-finger nucleic acid-binding protein
MQCPKCSENMQVKTILNVEIDIWESCKGIWLAEGELSKSENTQEE